jgi:hypothetical protein
MLRKTFLALALSLSPILIPIQGSAQQATSVQSPQLAALFEAIGMYDILEVMSAEGIDYADDLEMDMFPGRGGAAWAATVARIYSPDRMRSSFEGGFAGDLLDEVQGEELIAFFTSEVGQRIIRAEVLARREFRRDGVEEAANEVYLDRLAANDPRIELLNEFSDANSLIDLNVAGALNSNFAFYRGLVDGGAFAMELPQDMMLAEVWNQEAEIREETILWVNSYQLMAYDALSDADLQAYIDLSETAAGRMFNAAVFAAFDEMFEAISYELGTVSALFISGEET